MYRAIVLSTLLFDAETLTVLKADAHRFLIFIMRHLCKILNVKLWQHIPQKVFLWKFKLYCMYNILA